ncbi:MAG: dihydroneopterin aldolase [Methylacidiphilales bacterium]|nr:dihydroneopterin aldolase [Candidatus Methylacidiphilales bacterium]
MDSIELFVQLGVSPQERSKPQRVRFSVVYIPQCYLDSGEDLISKTVDYEGIVQILQKLASTHTFHLVEYLAERCAYELFSNFELTWIKVTATKFNPMPSVESTTGYCELGEN